MTFDEAKMALIVCGQDAFKDLFQPCTCGGGGLVHFQVYTKLPVEARASSGTLPKEPCRACKALQVISAAVALVSVPTGESPHIVSFFVRGVEELYPL